MRLLSMFLALLFAWQMVSANTNDDDKKKNKTDAMLFGDVKAGGEHIPFATITIKGTTIGTAADATGHFKMADLPLGEQIIVVSAVGYKTLEKQSLLQKSRLIGRFLHIYWKLLQSQRLFEVR